MIEDIDEHDGVTTVSTAESGAGSEGSTPAATGWPATFIEGLSGALDRAGVRWLILRNHEDIPDRVGHDIDIIVHPADAASVQRVIRSVVADRGLFLVRSY